VTDMPTRILLIDDDPDIHSAIRMILEPEGYEIHAHLTGPEGLEDLRKNEYDLVLLDIMLSSPLEGFYLMDEIRKEKKFKALPVIMISAIGETMGADYAKEMGTGLLEADLFLEKPLDAKSLRQAVKDVLHAARKD
jgi:DNA-binding response OmpR family regulator